MPDLRIALLDLNHATRGVTTNTVPLGIGLIAAHLAAMPGGEAREVRLYKFFDHLQNDLKHWVPDVAGISLFNHNTRLNCFAAGMIKALNPDCVVVAGGPNQHVEPSRREAFLRENPFIGLCLTEDGEIPFARTVERILAGEKLHGLKARPVEGGYALCPDTGALRASDEPTSRLPSLDVFGPLYASGFFDSFLDLGCYPYIQTHRGCPFSCAFCTSGQPWHNRVIFMSPDIFALEMDYLGRRFKGRDEIPLQLANTNMSLFEQDFPIAEILARSQRDFGWPMTIHTNSGKDTSKLLRMQKIVSFVPDVALQTLTPKVLSAIGRRNIPMEEFQALQNEMIRQGRPTATELILSLPGETKASFLETVATVARSGVQRIVVYTQMHLAGTALATSEWEKRAGFDVRRRVVPRTFSRVGGELVLDTEEVVVGTRDMPIEDYFELRGLAFTLEIVFNAVELSPIRRLLLEHGADPWEWIRRVHGALPSHPRLEGHYRNFMADTRAELFESRESLAEFFSLPRNERALFEGALGDNLIRKYKLSVLTKDFLACLEIALRAAGELLPDTPQARSMLDALGSVLAMRDYSLLKPDAPVSRVTLAHDVPLWISGATPEPLSALAGRCEYEAIPSPEGLRRLEKLGRVHGDRELTLQMLFQYMENDCLWPVWRKADARENPA